MTQLLAPYPEARRGEQLRVYLRQNWLSPLAGSCVSDDCKIGGEPKEKWMIGVYLVGGMAASSWIISPTRFEFTAGP